MSVPDACLQPSTEVTISPAELLIQVTAKLSDVKKKLKDYDDREKFNKSLAGNGFEDQEQDLAMYSQLGIVNSAVYEQLLVEEIVLTRRKE